jgi:transcriptional regulator with XRE-family HTH domain
MESAAILRDARARAGLTQAELAHRAGTSQATVSAYERGRKTPSVETLVRLLAATGTRLTAMPASAPVVRPTKATRHAPELRFPPLTRRRTPIDVVRP